MCGGHKKMMQKDVHMTHIMIQNYNTSNSCRQPTISSCCYFVCTKNLDDCLANFYSNLILWFRKVAKHVGDLLHLFFFQICAVNSSKNLLLDSFACSFFLLPRRSIVYLDFWCATLDPGDLLYSALFHVANLRRNSHAQNVSLYFGAKTWAFPPHAFFASARQNVSKSSKRCRPSLSK
jgi:hypothetical protein